MQKWDIFRVFEIFEKYLLVFFFEIVYLFLNITSSKIYLHLINNTALKKNKFEAIKGSRLLDVYFAYKLILETKLSFRCRFRWVILILLTMYRVNQIRYD